MIKLFILILFLFPKILLGLTIGDDGKISSSSEESTSNLTSTNNGDVFLLKNAGLPGEDTTLNIPGGSELGSKNLQNRYSTYKNIMKKIDYNILSVLTEDTRYGETALVFRVGKTVSELKQTVQEENLIVAIILELNFLPLTIMENLKIMHGHLSHSK